MSWCNKEIVCTLWNSKAHDHIHNSHSLVPIQIMIRFNVILHLCLDLISDLLPAGFPTKRHTHSPPPRASRPAQMILDFITLNNVWRGVHLMKLFIMQFPPTSSYFLALIVMPSPPWSCTFMFFHLSHDLAGVFLTSMAQARVTACILSTVGRHKTSNLGRVVCLQSCVHLRVSEGYTSSIFWVEGPWMLALIFLRYIDTGHSYYTVSNHKNTA